MVGEAVEGTEGLVVGAGLLVGVKVITLVDVGEGKRVGVGEGVDVRVGVGVEVRVGVGVVIELPKDVPKSQVQYMPLYDPPNASK